MSTAHQPLPIVYLPGASGAGAVWHPVHAARQSAQIAVIVDYPGLGDDVNEPALGSYPQLFEWISSQLPMRFHLAAISMGSLPALELCLEQAERVASLTLVAPVGGLNTAHYGATNWRTSWSLRRPHSPRWLVDNHTNLQGRLHEIRCRTLIVAGDADDISPLQVGKIVQQKIASARFEAIAGATHDILAEQPRAIDLLIREHMQAGAL